MSSWTTVSLGEIANVIAGQSPSGATYNTDREGVPFLQGSAEFGTRSPQHVLYCSQPRKLAPPKSILFSVRAPVGSVNEADTTYCIGRGLAAIVPTRVEPEFLYQLLRLYSGSGYRHLAQGSAFDAIATEQLKELPVSVPSRDEQREIVRILSAADAQIDQAAAVIGKRRRIKTGLLQDLLARGLDADGRLRHETTHAFHDTPLGRLPVEWDVLPLGTAAAYINRGKSPVYADHSPHAVLNQACVFADGLRFSNLKYVTPAYWEQLSPARRLQTGDVLINSTGTGTLGRVGYYSGPNGRLTYDSHVTVLRVDPARHESAYLFHEVRSPRVQNQIEAFCISGSTNQTELSKTELLTVLAAFPLREEQLRIVAVLDAADAEIAADEAALAKLRRVKAGLLRDLITGRVPVARLLAGTPAA